MKRSAALKLFDSKPKFIKSATHPSEFPLLKDDRGELLPEIAIAGRSNVGKSSMLNHLFAVKDLVKTSSTPGKTQLLNFFYVPNQLCCVDLPGYGFAKVPVEIRKKWGPMVQKYLQNRETLELILFLIDIRRIPSEEDLQLMDWILEAGKAVILVITKIDKVNENEKAAQTVKILEAFDLPDLHYVHYSVPKNKGREELGRMIKEAFEEEV